MQRYSIIDIDGMVFKQNYIEITDCPGTLVLN